MQLKCIAPARYYAFISVSEGMSKWQDSNRSLSNFKTFLSYQAQTDSLFIGAESVIFFVF